MTRGVNPGGLQGAPETKLGVLRVYLLRDTQCLRKPPRAVAQGQPAQAQKNEKRNGNGGSQRKAFLLGQVPATFAVANPPFRKSKPHSTLEMRKSSLVVQWSHNGFNFIEATTLEDYKLYREDKDISLDSTMAF